METKAVLFCVIVGVLGIISAIVGFVGEATSVKKSEVVDSRNISDLYDCYSPNRPTRTFAILGIVFAIITQIYISFTFGACKYFRYDPNSTTKSKFLIICSWIATVVALVQFSRASRESYLLVHCHILQPGTFAAGGIFALCSAVFGIAAYVTVSGAPKTTTNPPVVGVPMGANFDPEKNTVPYPPAQYPPSYQVG